MSRNGNLSELRYNAHVDTNDTPLKVGDRVESTSMFEADKTYRGEVVKLVRENIILVLLDEPWVWRSAAHLPNRGPVGSAAFLWKKLL